MEKFTIYNGKIWGHDISIYGKQNGYLDYRTLSNIIGDMILNNNVMKIGYPEDWEVESGSDKYYWDENGNEITEDEYYELEDAGKECGMKYYDIYQTYIISDRGAEILKEYTNEIVYYNNELDMYIWGITHFGTSWDYVLTNIKLSEMDNI